MRSPREIEIMKILITLCCCCFRVGLSVSVATISGSKYLYMLSKALELFEQIS